jgi:Flp pilus assembly pilin Flp
MNNPWVRQRGQGMVEYIIIVALIALAAIAAFSFFGQSVRGQTAQMALQVSGSAGDDSGISVAEDAAADALQRAERDVGLGDYHNEGVSQ